MTQLSREREEELSTERLLDLIDEQARIRGDAVLAELDATERITELASEARRQGVPMGMLRMYVRRMDRRERRLKPVTRQALDTMLAVFENRRPARTTRASRRAQDEGAEKATGTLNLEALS